MLGLVRASPICTRKEHAVGKTIAVITHYDERKSVLNLRYDITDSISFQNNL